MELRIWQFEKDDKYIDSWLTSASLAHNIPKKDEAWWHWKFEQSPYGKAILACAFDGDKVAGCVSMGKGLITYNEDISSYTLVYETFVHPNYQGRGLFTKLILLLEAECKAQGSSISYIFPNSKAIRGWIKAGYHLVSLSRYMIRICNPIKVAVNLRDMRKNFISLPSNIEALRLTNLASLPIIKMPDTFVPQWTSEYLRWRFLTYPVGNYTIINSNDVIAIFRNGYRGSLKESQLLHVASRNSYLSKRQWKYVLSELYKREKPDFVGVSVSKEHPVYPLLNLFVKVPDHSNFTYKLLDSSISPNTFKMAMSGIDAHTY